MSFDTDTAYAAGLFEGEGSVHAVDYYYIKGEKRSRKTPQIKVQISMSDREPLEKFVAVFGGRITGPYTHSSWPGSKPQYKLMLDNQSQAKVALETMRPMLSPRRQEQIDKALGSRS